MRDLFEKALRFEKTFDRTKIQPYWFDVLRSSVVFTVDEAVVRIASDMSDMRGGVSRVAPFFRLPYPRIFLQWPAKAQFRPSDGVRSGAAYFPSWHGAMLEYIGEERARHLENIVARDVLVQVVLENGQLAAPHFIFALFRHSELVNAPDWAKSASAPGPSSFWAASVMPQGYTMSAAEGDHQAEIVILPWLLAAINSPNLTASKDSPRSAPGNAKRPHGYKVQHRTVSLKLSRVQINRLGLSGDKAVATRLHSVRGHFKVRKSGIFWWSDYWRGSADQGVVAKRYDVEK